MEYFLNLFKRSSVTEDDNDESNPTLRDILEDVVRATRRRASFSSNFFGRRGRVSRQQRKDAMYKRYSCTASSERLSDTTGRLSGTSRRLSDTTRSLAETTRLLNGNMNGSSETVMPLSNSRCHTNLKKRRSSCPLGSPQSGNHTHVRHRRERRKSYAGWDKTDDQFLALPRHRRSANSSSTSIDSDVFADSTYQTQLPHSGSTCSEQNYSSSHSEQLQTAETSARRLFNSLRDNLLSLRGDSAETVEESVARQLKERKKAMKNLKLTRRQSRDFIRSKYNLNQTKSG